MSEYIKKSDAIEYLNDLFGEMYHVTFGNVLQSIDSLQTYSFPDSAENKGEWIEHKTKNGTVVALTCPKCMKSPKNAIRSDFCPNCGADMRGGE